MIMDSVEDLNLIHDIWPKASHGAVLVTSRNPALSIGPAAGGLEIEAFPDPEGSEIIMGVVARPRSSIEEREAAQRLSARLGGLALTLVVMASQIRLRGMTISRFLDFYEIYTGRLQKSQPGMGVASKQSLERSWDSIFDYLRDSSPDAAKILGVVAFMAPDWIPKRLFTQDQMPDDLEFCKDEWRCVPSSSDMITLTDVYIAIQVWWSSAPIDLNWPAQTKPVRRYALRRQAHSRCLPELHGDRQVPGPVANHFHAALWYFSKASEWYLHETTLDGLQIIYLPRDVSLHSLQRSAAHRRCKVRVESFFGAGNFLWLVCMPSSLIHRRRLTWLHRYLMESGAWNEGVELMETAMPLCHDKEGLVYANLANSLGCIECERGHVATSNELTGTGLRIRQNLLPEDHVEVANSLNNYANVILQRLDAHACERALDLYTKCVAINMKASRSHSDKFLHIPHTNMARALWVLGNYEDSIKHAEKSREYSVGFLGKGNHFDGL